MRSIKQWDVRGAVNLAAVFHFLHSSASGCLLPFLTLYLRHLGLSAGMTGAVMAVKHLVCLVWKPVSCVMARRYNKRRVVVTTSLVFSAAVVLMLLLFPPMEVSMERQRCNVTRQNANHTVYGYDSKAPESRTRAQNFSTPAVYSAEHMESPTNSQYTTKVRSNSSAYFAAKNTKKLLPTFNTVKGGPEQVRWASKEGSTQGIHIMVTTDSGPHGRRIRSLMKREGKPELKTHYEFLGSLKVMDAQHQMFFLVMIVIGLWEIISAPLQWTIDDGLYEYLDFVDATDRYSAVKPWRLLGVAGGAGCCGILVSVLYCIVGPALHFYAYAAMMVLALPVAAFFPLYLHKRVPLSGLKALQLVRGDSRAMLSACTAVLTGMASSAMADFFLWQMQDLNATELQMGITLALAPLFQAVFTPLNKTLSRLLKSHGRLQLLGIVGMSLQCLYYSFIWAPWIALPAQLLAAFSVGALWWSLEAQCVDVASPGTERAVRRVYEALFGDVGAGLGSLAGGLVVSRFGVGALFQVAAALLAAWGVSLAVLQWRFPHRRRINYSRLLAANGSDASESESEQENDWLEKAMEEDKGNNNFRKVDK